MTWIVLLFLTIGLLLAVLFLGVRIFVGFLVLNLIGVLYLVGTRGFGMLTNSIVNSATSSTLVTVALFVLMGEILFRSGTVEILLDSIDSLIGRIKGRLYFVVIALSTVFGALSGSAVAVAAMLGRSLMPMMEERGYNRKLSAGTILSGASLAPIIPPSLLAIIVGSMADVSIAGLLIAGLIPGILFAGLTTLYVLFKIRALPPIGPEHNTDRKPVARSLLDMVPFLIVIASVMGLILLGVATPSEAAATGVVGALIVAAIFGRLNAKMLSTSISSTVVISCSILVIICSATLFSQLLSFGGITRSLVQYLTELSLSANMMFLIMMLIPFILCMFIDQIAFMLLAIPLYQPIIKSFDFDPIWFWTIFLINLTVASLTPPFGYTLFALKSANPSLSTGETYRAAWPIVSVFVLGMVILWAVPQLVTWLPSVFD